MGKGGGNHRTQVRQSTTQQNTSAHKLHRSAMNTSSIMAEMDGYVLGRCVSELVRIKVVDWSENGNNGESMRAHYMFPPPP
jgi:hypothetical protein